MLPRSAESTRIIGAQRAFSREETLPLIVVWTAEGGGGPVGEEPSAPDDVRRATAQVPGTTAQLAGPAASQADLSGRSPESTACSSSRRS